MSLQVKYKRRIKIESPGRMRVLRGHTKSVAAVLSGWLDSATKKNKCQSQFMCCSLPKRTQVKNRFMCGIDPMHPKALRLRVYTGLTYRGCLHRPYMWTGGVRSLLDAFKAFSKTCLINTQEAVEPKADSVLNGGLSGRGTVTKGKEPHARRPIPLLRSCSIHRRFTYG